MRTRGRRPRAAGTRAASKLTKLNWTAPGPPGLRSGASVTADSTADSKADAGVGARVGAERGCFVSAASQSEVVPRAVRQLRLQHS